MLSSGSRDFPVPLIHMSALALLHTCSTATSNLCPVHAKHWQIPREIVPGVSRSTLLLFFLPKRPGC